MDKVLFERLQVRQKQAGLFTLLLLAISSLISQPELKTFLLFLPSISLVFLALQLKARSSNLLVYLAYAFASIGLIAYSFQVFSPWLQLQFLIISAFLLFPVRVATNTGIFVLSLFTALAWWISSQISPDSWLSSAINGLALSVFTIIVLGSLQRRIDSLEINCEAARRKDPATGLANREVLIEFLEDAISIHKRYGLSSTALQLEISGEAINDGASITEREYNELVKKWIEIWQSRIRKTDRLCRLEHKTFVILLNGTSDAQAASLAEDLVNASYAYDVNSKFKLEIKTACCQCPESDGVENWLSELNRSDRKILNT